MAEKVENALYKRAVGYTYNEVTRESVKDQATGEESLQVTKVVTKQVAPDTCPALVTAFAAPRVRSANASVGCR